MSLGRVCRADVSVIGGMKITGATRFLSGIYRSFGDENGMVQISGRGYTLDLAGVKLRSGGKNTGVGIMIRDARDITLKNADVRGMRWGIVIERSANIRLENCRFDANGNLPYGTVIDESGNQPEDQHGGGILIRDSAKCRVVKCQATHQWDGIDVVRSNENIIEQSDFSYNNNWGVHFWASSRNRFEKNKAIWCTTGASLLYQGVSGWQTYDAQAVAIDHNSHENRIEGNDLRFGGDGIFIRANEGALYPDSGIMTPVKNGSHRNILRNNDCSFSPNNAIEVDFVDDTIIEGNNCSHSNYGIWLGYSRRSIVRNNLILNCSSKGIEIENGQGGVIEHNVMGSPPEKPAQTLIYLRQNGRDKTPSSGYVIRHNQFIGGGQAILLRNTSAIVQDNLLTEMKTEKAVSADSGSMVQESGTQTVATAGRDFTAAWIKQIAIPKFPEPNDPKSVSILNLGGTTPKAGEWVTVIGTDLGGARIYVNGILAEQERGTAEMLKFRVPKNFNKAMRVHVVAIVGEDEDSKQSVPAELEVKP